MAWGLLLGTAVLKRWGSLPGSPIPSLTASDQASPLNLPAQPGPCSLPTGWGRRRAWQVKALTCSSPWDGSSPAPDSAMSPESPTILISMLLCPGKGPGQWHGPPDTSCFPHMPHLWPKEPSLGTLPLQGLSKGPFLFRFPWGPGLRCAPGEDPAPLWLGRTRPHSLVGQGKGMAKCLGKEPCPCVCPAGQESLCPGPLCL